MLLAFLDSAEGFIIRADLGSKYGNQTNCKIVMFKD